MNAQAPFLGAYFGPSDKDYNQDYLLLKSKIDDEEEKIRRVVKRLETEFDLKVSRMRNGGTKEKWRLETLATQDVFSQPEGGIGALTRRFGEPLEQRKKVIDDTLDGKVADLEKEFLKKKRLLEAPLEEKKGRLQNIDRQRSLVCSDQEPFGCTGDCEKRRQSPEGCPLAFGFLC